MSHVPIIRTGNTIIIDTVKPAVLDQLVPALTYVEREWLKGRAERLAREAGEPIFIDHTVDLYVEDHRGRLVTAYGLLERLWATLTAAGHTPSLQVVARNRSKPPHPRVYEPR